MDARQVELRLLFSNQSATINSAVFGPIQQGEYRVTPQSLMTETFDDPAGYYVRLGEAYLSSRNPRRALEAYQRALDFAPGDPGILSKIESVKYQLAGDGQ